MSQSARTEPDTLNFRPIETADEALLLAIYASTRSEEMAMLPDWPEEQKAAFLTQQFQAQHQYYQGVYQNREFMVMLCGDQVAGRLYLDHRPNDVRIVDITLLPDFRGRGLGEQVLRGILEKARAAGKTVSIHVERMNRARHLYERLGFSVIDESNQVYLLMEWRS